MSTTKLDENGVVVACPQCGQRNRIQYERLNQTVRCGKCKSEIPGATTPVDVASEELAATSAGKFIVAKVNTEAQGALAHRYAIHSIPTMILFVRGEEAARTAGAMPAARIGQFAEDGLKHAKV
jgi:thioredoxin 2